MVNPETEPRLDFDQPTDGDFKKNVSEFYDFTIHSEPEGVIKIIVNFRGELFNPPKELAEKIALYCSKLGYIQCLIKNPTFNRYLPVDSFQTAEKNILNSERYQKESDRARRAAIRAGDPFGVEGGRIDGRYMDQDTNEKPKKD